MPVFYHITGLISALSTEHENDLDVLIREFNSQVDANYEENTQPPKVNLPQSQCINLKQKIAICEASFADLKLLYEHKALPFKEIKANNPNFLALKKILWPEEDLKLFLNSASTNFIQLSQKTQKFFKIIVGSLLGDSVPFEVIQSQCSYQFVATNLEDNLRKTGIVDYLKGITKKYIAESITAPLPSNLEEDSYIRPIQFIKPKSPLTKKGSLKAGETKVTSKLSPMKLKEIICNFTWIIEGLLPKHLKQFEEAKSIVFAGSNDIIKSSTFSEGPLVTSGNMIDADTYPLGGGIPRDSIFCNESL